MSPREKQQLIFLFSLSAAALLIFTLLLYYIPTVLYVSLILGVCGIACYYYNGQSLYARLGPVDPRRGLTVVAALRRWLTGRAKNGGAAYPPPAAGRTSRSHRGVGNKAAAAAHVVVRGSGAYSGFGVPETAGGLGVYRRGGGGGGGDSVFSPRDILMGSYISRPEGPPPQVVKTGRGSGSGAVVYPRDQLRERLSRPNHAVHSPNRRLSFSGEQVGTASRFSITPQRHYPLQQTGTSSVGLLPPAHWDSFRKKNILSPRNSSVHASPVTVKIARPDHSTYRSPFLEHVGSPGGLCSPGPTPPADPCSRETVLKVLKESRKREVADDEDRTLTDEQKSKRRRNDSGGSAHSAFEPLLPNGVQSQLVPKPGTLKRGLNFMAEEAVMKRSRTSSISSVSGGHIHTSGSVRNPIQSSYSSSQGFSQWKRASTHASPLSSPMSSRSQTPERASVKPREDDTQSPSSASSVKSDKVVMDTEPTISKVAPVPKVPVALSSSSTSSGGKRKRKIQLVASHGGEQISLPPPPELGYTITVKDLDQEKRAALHKIQKVLEEVAPEPKKPEPPVAETAPSSQAASSSSVDSGPTLASLLAAPLPTIITASSSSSAPISGVAAAPTIPVINLDPSPAATTTTSMSTAPTFTAAAPARSSPAPPAAAPAPGLPNSLLEILKMQSVPPASSPSMLSTTTAGPVFTTNTDPNGSVLKPASAMAQPPPPYSASTLSGLTQPSSSVSSAFSQVLGGQTTKTTMAATSLFGLTTSSSASSTSPFTSAPMVPGTESAASTTNPLLVTGFKPIFGAAPASTASDGMPAVPTFKPLFGSAGGGFGQPAAAAAATSAPTATSVSTTSMFGGSLSSAAAAAPPSMFGSLATGTSGMASSVSTSTTAGSAVKPMFGNWGAPSTTSGASTLAPPSVTTGAFGVQFGAPPHATTAAPAAQTSSTSSAFAFGAAPATTAASTIQPAPAAAAAAQNPFGFGQAAAGGQNPTTMSFGGFAMPNATVTAAAAAPAAPQQPSFSFGKPPSFEAATTTTTAPPPAYPGSTMTMTAAVKPFSFGGGNGAAAAAPAPAPTGAPAASPFTFGGAAVGPAPTAASTFGPAPTTASTFGPAPTAASTFGTPAKPAFGSGGPGFSFGGAAAPQAAPPSFGAPTQTQTAQAAGFGFGGAAAVQQTPAGPAANPASGFNFGGAMTGAQFQTPVSNNPPPQMSVSGFNFGAAAGGAPTFGTSTPTFGQSAQAGPIPFGSPATPVQGFNSVAPSPFGAPTPSFSIGLGASSKPSGARQRLQARRQHPRKK